MPWPFRRRRPEAGEAEVAARLREALRLALAGDLAKAEAALADTARFDSSSADLYLALANLYRARGEIGRGIQIHQNLLLQPGLPEAVRKQALLGLAQDFRAGGFLRRAAASFEELLETDPRNLEALLALEQIHTESGRLEAAIQIRRRIGGRDPETPRVLGRLFSELGRAKLREGDANEARKALRRALGHDPNAAAAYVALADQRLQEGKPRKAIGLYKRALELPDAPLGLVYAKLWEAHVAQGDLEALERLYRERLGARSGDLEASVWLARTLARRDRLDEAIARLQRTLDESPGFVPAHQELGRLLLQSGRDAQALKAYDNLLDRL